MILLQDVPDGYEYCFAGNGKCPKASSCLRAIAAQLLSESDPPQPQSVRAVNPFYVSSLSGSSTCARYRSSEQLHYARGMTHLFDEVPTKLLFTVRHRVMGCFSCERYYYHSLPQGRAAYLSRRTATDSPGIQGGRHKHQA